MIVAVEHEPLSATWERTRLSVGNDVVSEAGTADYNRSRAHFGFPIAA
jgi:hypothetical protein